MFWGCFTYDFKGPCHIWKKETAPEKAAAQRDLAKMNQDLEPEAKREWELKTGTRRLTLRGQPKGRKPTWKFQKKTGKLVRDGKAGGIDWYRYNKHILLPKLFPFAKQCGSDYWVLEDGAPSHSHAYNVNLYSLKRIQRLLHPPNSPDLNAIEKAWPWLKRTTTARGATTDPKEMERRWLKGWNDIPQAQIQVWIEGIMHNIQEVIRLEGGNKYKEGR
jgi:hypothetical protein